MGRSAVVGAPGNGIRSSSISTSLTQLILLVSVGTASFFAGTLLTLHSGIDRCDEVKNPLLQQQQFMDSSQAAEALAQKRFLGACCRGVCHVLNHHYQPIG